MKKIYCITLLIMSLMLVSCSKGVMKSDKTTIVFWHSMGGPLGTALNRLIEDFNSSQREIRVEAVSVGNYTALTQKLSAAIQAGNQPDIAQLYENSTVDYIQSGVLVPVENYIVKDSEFAQEVKDDFFSIFINSNTFDGKMWTFPFNKSVRVLYYNKDMFLRFGLDPNKAPKSWDEFIEYSKIISAELDKDGHPKIYTTNLNSSASQFVNLVMQAGGDIVVNDKAVFNNKAAVKSLKYLRRLVVDSDVAYLSKGYEGQNDFLAEKVAMYEGSSVSMAFLQGNQKLKFNIGIAPIPYDVSKKNAINGTNIAIFKSDAKKQAAAWTFIKWFTAAKQTAQWSDETYYMPLRKSALDVALLKDKLKTNRQLLEVYDQLNHAQSEPSLSEWRLTRKNIERFVLEPIYDANKSFDDNDYMKLLDDCVDEMNSRIKNNRESK